MESAAERAKRTLHASQAARSKQHALHGGPRAGCGPRFVVLVWRSLSFQICKAVPDFDLRCQLYHHTDTVAARQPESKLLLLFERECLDLGRHLVAQLELLLLLTGLLLLLLLLLL